MFEAIKNIIDVMIACGYENRDSWEYEHSEDEVECGDCGRLFDLEVHYEITYTTKKSECEKMA